MIIYTRTIFRIDTIPSTRKQLKYKRKERKQSVNEFVTGQPNEQKYPVVPLRIVWKYLFSLQLLFLGTTPEKDCSHDRWVKDTLVSFGRKKT